MGSISGVSRFFFLEAGAAAPASISDVGHWFQNEIVAIVLARILYINHFIVLRNGILETVTCTTFTGVTNILTVGCFDTVLPYSPASLQIREFTCHHIGTLHLLR
jgi:hypothetical protein